MLIRSTLEYRVLPVPFHILTLWGIWCPGHVNSNIKRIYSIFTLIVIILQSLLTIEVLIYLVIIIRTNQFEMDVFFIMISLINGVYKGLNILITRKRIDNLLIKGFEDRWRVPRDESEKKILVNFNNESWRIHLIYAMVCLIGVSIKLIGPTIASTNSDVILPTPAWYPYDTNKSLYFWLSYAQQMFVGSAIISMHIGADTMLSGFLHQSCIQLKLLKHRLRNFFKFCENTNSCSISPSDRSKMEAAQIRQYIYDQQFIYSYARSLNKNFAGRLLAMLTVVVPNICINVYFLSFAEVGLNIDFVTSLGLFSVSVFQIYLPCWYGNEVMLHSSEIGNAVYEMDWVNLAPTTKKALLIIMIRATKPIRLTVAHIIPLNIKSFLSIMKTSYSVLNVLQQT